MKRIRERKERNEKAIYSAYSTCVVAPLELALGWVHYSWVDGICSSLGWVFVGT